VKACSSFFPPHSPDSTSHASVSPLLL
jgi:hypothetical protein